MGNLTKLFNKLEANLSEFEKIKKAAVIASSIIRIFSILMAVAVLSLIFGFLNVFPFDEFDMKTAITIFKAFFYLILIIVVLSFSGDQLKQWYIKRNPNALKNKQAMWLKRIILSVIIIIITYFAGIYFLGEELFTTAFFVKFGGTVFIILILIIPVMLLQKVEKNFYIKFKKVVIPEILIDLKSDSTYHSDMMISQDLFEKSKLFDIHQIHRYRGNDLMEGKNNEINYKLSYLQVFDKEVRKSQNKTETKISEIFNGMFYVSDFNKKFSGHTIIIPDYSTEIMGKVMGEMLNEFIGRMGRKLVKLEDPAFESEFSVFSTDQIEARFILTPSFIERIKLLKQHFPDPFKISFIDDSIYIAIFSKRNLLDPDIFRKLNTYESFEKYNNNFNHLLSISNDLKLNINIWK